MRLSDFLSQADILRDGPFAALDEAGAMEPGALAFCQSLEYLNIANANANVAAMITTGDLAPEARVQAVAVAGNPRLAFFRLYRQLMEAGRMWPAMRFGIGEGCNIHPSATVSARARIGNRVTIGASAVIEDYVDIGDDSYVGPNAVIGAEGMQTVWEEDGTPLIVRHAGGVSIGRGVVVLAGAVVAKSLYRAFTRIGDYSQIGILASIGHGVGIGKRCVVSGNCVVAGRSTLGDGVWMGASATVAQGLRIGAGARIKMGSAVVRNVGEGQVVSGNFAMPHNLNMKRYLERMRP